MESRYNYFREFGERPLIDTVNFARLIFHYFVSQDNGTIVACARDDDQNEFTYAIEPDGSVRVRKNQGIWRQLPDRDAGRLRYYAGRRYNYAPTYHTRYATV